MDISDRGIMKMRLFAAISIASILLAGCSTSSSSQTSSSESGNGASDAPASQSLPEVENPDPAIQAPPANVDSGASGANAAPNQQVATFYAWWNYEVQTPQDASRPFYQVYLDGQSVCEARSRTSDINAIMKMIRRDQGYTDIDSSSLYKSALAGICPQFDYSYKTPFDRNVESMMTRLQGVVTFQVTPPYYDYGFFMKENCAFLQKYGGAGIYAHMKQMTHLRLITSYGAVEELAYRLLILRATTEGCYAQYDQLPYVIVMSQKEVDDIIAARQVSHP